jgi:hypothetical protein
MGEAGDAFDEAEYQADLRRQAALDQLDEPRDDWWCWECNGQGTWPDDEVLDGDDPKCQCWGGEGTHRKGPCPVSEPSAEKR